MSLLDIVIRAFLVLLGSCALLFFATTVAIILYTIDEKINKYINKYLGDKDKKDEK